MVESIITYFFFFFAIILPLILLLIASLVTYRSYFKRYFTDSSSFFPLTEFQFNCIYWTVTIISHFLFFTVSLFRFNLESFFWIRIFLIYPAFIWEIFILTFLIVLLLSYSIRFLIGVLEGIILLIKTFFIILIHKPVYPSLKIFYIFGLFCFISFSVYKTESQILIKEVYLNTHKEHPNLLNLKIIHISDPHFGYFMDPNKFKDIAKKINDLNADILFLTGDLIVKWKEDLDFVQKGLKMIRKHRYGNYMVLGNHEHYFNNKLVVRELKKINNFDLIINDKKVISHQKTLIEIFGIDFPFRHKTKSLKEVKKYLINKAMSKNPKLKEDSFKILLSHSPDVFDIAVDKKINLVLSGHTHGGQLRFNDKIGLGQMFYTYNYGLYKKIQKGLKSYIYVNPGLGVANFFPLRVGSPREITVINLGKNQKN